MVTPTNKTILEAYDQDKPLWELIRNLEIHEKIEYLTINRVPPQTHLEFRYEDARSYLKRKIYTSTENLQECNRLFVILPRHHNESDFFDHFSSFGFLDYLYTTKGQNGKGHYGYINYINQESAAKALKNADSKYRVKIAEPQKLQRGSCALPPTLHNECKQFVTTRTLGYHIKICEKQRKSITYDISENNIQENSEAKPMTKTSKISPHSNQDNGKWDRGDLF